MLALFRQSRAVSIALGETERTKLTFTLKDFPLNGYLSDVEASTAKLLIHVWETNRIFYMGLTVRGNTEHHLDE